MELSSAELELVFSGLCSLAAERGWEGEAAELLERVRAERSRRAEEERREALFA